MSEVLKFKNALLARSIVARIKESFEHSSPEEMREYLKQHPHADPKNHWVKKPGEGGSAKKEDESGSKSKSVKPLFSKEETEHLPEAISQPHKTKDEVYAAANEALTHQAKWLNQGQGLDKAIGAKVIRKDQGSKEEPDFDAPGPIIILGSVKKEGKAAGKVQNDYNGDWSKIGDLVRASVAVDSLDQLDDVMNKLKATGLKLARKPKDRFANPTDVGYRDLMLNVTYPNGHVGELQLHVKGMIKAKDAAHEAYNAQIKVQHGAQERAKAAGKDDKNVEYTPEEAQKIAHYMKVQRDFYDPAWQNLIGGSKEKTAKYRRGPMEKEALADRTKYYDVDGLPAYKENSTKSGVVLTLSGPRMLTVHELCHKASEISKEEFEKLKKANKIK